MGDLFQPTHLLIIFLIVLLLFGARKIPELGKGLGEGLKGFREGMKGITDPPPAAPVQQATASAAPQSGPRPAGKADYRCPNCKNIVTANAPNPGVTEEKGFCPECGSQFEKRTALVEKNAALV